MMAQLTLYIDEEILKRIEMSAKREHVSISQWVKNRLLKSFRHAWPQNYYQLFGSLSKDELKRPVQPKFSEDHRREKL